MLLRYSKGGRRGQSAVEFALVAPIFFVLFYTVFNGGLFLYSRVGLQDSAQTGALTVAAKGRAVDADTTAVSRMQQGALGSSSLVTVTEIDIYKMTRAADGTVSEATGCNGTGSSCRNRYTLQGVPIGTTNYWLPAQRIVSKGSSDFAGMDVIYVYHSTYSVFPSFSLTFTIDFRLEPQS